MAGMQAFIEEMKRRQSAQQSDGKGPKSLFVMPMRARFLGNTGTGENDEVEDEKPVMMMATGRGPRMIHEGENMYARRDGKIEVVPAKKSQEELEKMEHRMRMPGYQAGGTFDLPSEVDNPNIEGDTGVVGSWAPAKPDSGPAVASTTPVDAIDQSKDTLTGSLPSIRTTAARTGTAQTFRPVEVPTIGGALPKVTETPAPITGAVPTAQARTGTNVVINPTVSTTPPPPPPKTGLDYARQGMESLSKIAEGGSPALKAIQDKYIQDLKSTQGVSDRMRGFEAAQAGVGKEVAAARQAMGRAVAGSQLGQAESEMAANEMKQREQAAADLAARGSTLQSMEQTERQPKMAQANAMVSAGDYTGANEIFSSLGLPPIDFSKVEAGDLNTVTDQITEAISNLGPDADPNVISGLYGMLNTIRTKQWSAYGIDPTKTSFKNADGADVPLATVLSTIDNPASASPQTAQSVAKLSAGALGFYDTPEGDIAMEQLSTIPEWNSLYDKAKAGDETAATEMGKVMGAIWVQQNYINDPTAPAPNATQTEILKKYGVYREPVITQAQIQPKLNSINTMLQNGDTAGAQQAYNNLSDAEKKMAGPWESVSATGVKALADTVIAKNDYTAQLTGKTPDDPLYKAIFDKTPMLSLSYNNNAWKDDTISGAPPVGTWVKYQTPDGVKLMQVTFNGLLNTAGTSDRAYLEFQDAQGNVYSTSGNSTTLVKGKNTKFSRK